MSLLTVVGGCGETESSGVVEDTTAPETVEEVTVGDGEVTEADVGPGDVVERPPLPPGPEACQDADQEVVSLLVRPYLQLATPTSVWIYWETDEGTETRVDWGYDDALGAVTCGYATDSWEGTWLHSVQLDGLTPSTSYSYRIQTGGTTSQVHRLRTPPRREDEKDFSLVVVSDMQIDLSNPTKWSEVIHDGVIDFMEAETGLEPPESLGMVLVPGDLVDNGWMYEQWSEDYFAQAADLMAQVPFYPVLGNHESNTPFYFDYFHLPDNGDPDYQEHWWTLDYSNVRVIGLDSNDGFRVPVQLEWLSGVLQDACADPEVDFVFAELHHPHKSELWVAGEIDYTGDVIALLEDFSTGCGKPSVHFFGHTHGYSRGQSRDHHHLWVNAASSGGNIDYWGEYLQADYDEFTVSHDDWGFVLVDVEAGDDPSFRLRRVSRGNEDTPMDNVVRDQLQIRRHNLPPEAPTVIPPGDGALCDWKVTLVGTPFVDGDGDAHGGSHWQVSTDCEDFSAPIYDTWVQHENWYMGQDTQAGDDLVDEEVTGLLGGTFCARLRYRDQGLSWSPWSQAVPFETGGLATDDLLVNPGGELLLEGWEVTAGTMESLAEDECGALAPWEGERHFVLGGLCDGSETPYAQAHQAVTVPDAFVSAVDGGGVQITWGAALSTWIGDDDPTVRVRFLDETGEVLEETAALTSPQPAWTLVMETTPVPAGTRQLDMVLTGTRHAGTDNDSYVDAVKLNLLTCEE